MVLLTFDDIEIGLAARSEPAILTREAILAFAQMYDPQPFHLDEAAGAASLLGGLAASGWHTGAVGIRLVHDCLLHRLAAIGSPCIDEVRWLRPVRPGDALTAEVAVTAKRPSTSRPDRGLVTLATTIHNAGNEAVMTLRAPVIVMRRGAPVPAPAPRPARPTAAPAPPPPAEPLLTAFFTELTIGMAATFGTQVFAADLMIPFATLYDPQPFHIDAAAAAASPFGGLVASGWQVGAFWMKHYIAARTRAGEARVAAGLPAAVGGPSPGFQAMRWLRPTYVGDSITYGLEITGLRRAGRSNWGMVQTRNTGRAADGTLVFAFEGRLLWPLMP